jgi:caffeoyl-CoA O-methyltransferase
MGVRPTIASAGIDAYCEEHTTPEPQYLRAVAEEALATLDSPGMMSGRIEGRFLQTLVWISEARTVLEIGTYAGYSALAMAAALPEGGRVITLELDADLEAFARRRIEASPLADRIEQRGGPALDTIESLDGPFDLVFIDADKPGYAGYYDAVVPKLAPHGLIVADNTLWHGEALDPTDESGQAMAAFNDHVAADPRTVQVLLPARDGITLIRLAS